MPLVSDHPHAIDVGQRVGGGQGLALSRGAGDRHRSRWRVIHIGHARCGNTGNGLHGAAAVGVTGAHADLTAHLRFSQGQFVGRGAIDRGPGFSIGGALPLVSDHPHAIDIGQRVGGGQSLALSRGAGDGDTAGGEVIDVRHCEGGVAGNGLRGAETIGITRAHPDPPAHLCIGQAQGVVRGAIDRGPGQPIGSALPLVSDRTQAIKICEGIGCRECLILCGGAADGDAARWGVVDVGDASGRYRGDALGIAAAIDIAHPRAQLLLHFALTEIEGAEVCAADVGPSHPVAAVLPLIGKGAQTIRIREGVRQCQHLALCGLPLDRDGTCYAGIETAAVGLGIPKRAIGKGDLFDRPVCCIVNADAVQAFERQREA